MGRWGRLVRLSACVGELAPHGRTLSAVDFKLTSISVTLHVLVSW